MKLSVPYLRSMFSRAAAEEEACCVAVLVMDDELVSVEDA